jgi:hypothetical protein
MSLSEKNKLRCFLTLFPGIGKFEFYAHKNTSCRKENALLFSFPFV